MKEASSWEEQCTRTPHLPQFLQVQSETGPVLKILQCCICIFLFAPDISCIKSGAVQWEVRHSTYDLAQWFILASTTSIPARSTCLQYKSQPWHYDEDLELPLRLVLLRRWHMPWVVLTGMTWFTMCPLSLAMAGQAAAALLYMLLRWWVIWCKISF